MKKPLLRTARSLLLCLYLHCPAWSWGNEGHSAINRVAAEKLPPDVPTFLRDAAAQLAYLGPEPDRWREHSELALKRAQEPDHFIDLEMVEGMDLPPDRYSFYRALRPNARRHPAIPSICCRNKSDCSRTSRSRCTNDWSSPSVNIATLCSPIAIRSSPSGRDFLRRMAGTLRRRRRQSVAHHDSLQRMDRAES